MLTEESLLGFIQEMSAHIMIEPQMFFISEHMHKRLWLLQKLASSGLLRESPRTLRKVHVRRIVARRKALRQRLERIYETSHKLEMARLERMPLIRTVSPGDPFDGLREALTT